MRIRAAGDERHDSRCAKLRAFLDRPLHAVELEDGKEKSDGRSFGCGHIFPQVELNPALLNGDDASPPYARACGDVEFLAHASAKHTYKMLRVFARESGFVPRDFIGNPSAAGHGGSMGLGG